MPDLITVKPWRTSTRSGGGACVQIALVVKEVRRG